MICTNLTQNLGPEGGDVMIYSPNVIINRDDDYQFITAITLRMRFVPLKNECWKKSL